MGSKSGFGGNVLGAAGVEAPRSTGRNPDQFPNLGEAPPPPIKIGPKFWLPDFWFEFSLHVFCLKKKMTRVYSEEFFWGCRYGAHW